MCSRVCMHTGVCVHAEGVCVHTEGGCVCRGVCACVKGSVCV